MEVDKLEQNEQYYKQAAVASVHLITWQIIIFFRENLEDYWGRANHLLAWDQAKTELISCMEARNGSARRGPRITRQNLHPLQDSIGRDNA